jgi:hypothetical protein
VQHPTHHRAAPIPPCTQRLPPSSSPDPQLSSCLPQRIRSCLRCHKVCASPIVPGGAAWGAGVQHSMVTHSTPCAWGSGADRPLDAVPSPTTPCLPAWPPPTASLHSLQQQHPLPSSQRPPRGDPVPQRVSSNTQGGCPPDGGIRLSRSREDGSRRRTTSSGGACAACWPSRFARSSKARASEGAGHTRSVLALTNTHPRRCLVSCRPQAGEEAGRGPVGRCVGVRACARACRWCACCRSWRCKPRRLCCCCCCRRTHATHPANSDCQGPQRAL